MAFEREEYFGVGGLAKKADYICKDCIYALEGECMKAVCKKYKAPARIPQTVYAGEGCEGYEKMGEKNK